MSNAASPKQPHTSAVGDEAAAASGEKGAVTPRAVAERDVRLGGDSSHAASSERMRPSVDSGRSSKCCAESSTNLSRSPSSESAPVPRPGKKGPESSYECCSDNSSTHVHSSNSSSSISNSSSSSSSHLERSSGCSGGSKDPREYGIPRGEETMRSLRRHVELLIDREMNTKSRSRLETCLDALEPETLDPQLLRVVCAKGLPEGCPALRSLYWRILLHCLPLNISEWQQHREKLRVAYESYKAEFIREPEAVRRLRRMQQQQQQQQKAANSSAQEGAASSATPPASRCSPSSDDSSRGTSSPEPGPFSIPLAAVNDHPLSRNETSEWRGYWVDAEVFDQINKDVFRTRPELCFFALNPQQTVARQQQLHLYPPPHTRQPQSSMPPIDEVPLLVSYDVVLERQKQQRATECTDTPAPHSSKLTSNSTKNSSGNNKESDSCTRTSTLGRKGFRLPAAFRLKKAASFPATNKLVEDACSSTKSSSSSKSKRQEASHPGSECCAGAADPAKQRQVEDDAAGRGEGKLDSSFIDKSVSHWIDQLQRGAAAHRSRKPADAADALEATAAAAKAARQYRRRTSSAKLHGEDKGSRTSASSLHGLSRDSVESDPADAGAQAANSALPDVDKEGPAQRLSKTLPDVTAGASMSPDVAPSSFKGEERVTDSSSLADNDLAVPSESAGQRGAASAVLSGAKSEQQPWRAPAGVQDVCNMLKPRRHYDVLSRLLFIYAKVNPGLCYVQGMNEILAPIYYTLMTDPTYTDYEQAEAEVFYCFSEVMQQQRDAFCKALDPTDSGVRGRLSRLDCLLRHKDEEIWMHLNAMGVEPQFYALRWLLLMLTQEFEMPDVLALWDGFIADSGRPLPLLYYVCVSMIIWLKPALLAGDFTACMKLLQHLPSFDPKALISSAVRMRADDLLGTRSLPWRAPLPMAVGESRSRDGFEVLGPLQVLESQLKPPNRAASPSRSHMAGLVSSSSLASLHAKVATWGKDRREHAGDTAGVSSSSGSKADASPEGNFEATDAALGHLKRLAGAGVEHAYKGATVVSQYLNSSGLAVGIASNITSFFSSDPTSRSPDCVAEGPEASAASRALPSLAAKKLGTFFSPSPPAGDSAPRTSANESLQTVNATADARCVSAPIQAREKPRLTSREPLHETVSESFPSTDGFALDYPQSPEQRHPIAALSPAEEPQVALDELLDTPRSTDAPSFSSPTSGGVQITILYNASQDDKKRQGLCSDRTTIVAPHRREHHDTCPAIEYLFPYRRIALEHLQFTGVLRPGPHWSGDPAGPCPGPQSLVLERQSCACAALFLAPAAFCNESGLLVLPPRLQDASTESTNAPIRRLAAPLSSDLLQLDHSPSTGSPSVRVYRIGEEEGDSTKDTFGQHGFASPTIIGFAFLPGPLPPHPRLRRLSSNTLGSFIGRVSQRLSTATTTFVAPQYEEVRGQSYLARYAVKLNALRRRSQSGPRLWNYLKSLRNTDNNNNATNGTNGTTGTSVVLSNGVSTVSAQFVSELQATPAFTDALAQEEENEWIGRFYVENPPAQDASATLQKDFAILNCAPTGESIETFRHRMRLNIPIQLYTIVGAGDYLQAPDGQVFINAVARRPLIQATAMQLLACYCKKLRGTRNGLRALMSMSQQSVTAVSNLNCMAIVHTNINPNEFLVTQKGLVFLGGLQQAVTEGSQLPDPLLVEAGFVPPEVQQQLTNTATFAQDAWELGLTLFSYWCGTVPALDSDESFVFPFTDAGILDFSSCSARMPQEMQDLIMAFTQIDPQNRLLPEKAVTHAAMLLPINGDNPTVDTNQDDDDSDQVM
ncbi:hypothetical protein Emed_001516 [Eimeria media]